MKNKQIVNKFIRENILSLKDDNKIARAKYFKRVRLINTIIAGLKEKLKCNHSRLEFEGDGLLMFHYKCKDCGYSFNSMVKLD